MKRPSGKCVVSVFLVSKSVGMIPNECAKQCKIMETNNRNDRRSSILVPHIFLKFGCHYGYVYCTLKSVEPALVVADVLVPEWRNDVRMASVRSVAIESFVDPTQRVYQRLVFVFTQVLLHERKKKLHGLEVGAVCRHKRPFPSEQGLDGEQALDCFVNRGIASTSNDKVR